MKNFKTLYTTIIIAVLFVGCEQVGELDLAPQDLVSSSIIYEDKSLADAYLAQIYNNTLIWWTDFRGQGGVTSMGLIEGMGGVCRGFAYWQTVSAFPITVIDGEGAGPIDYWPYGNIREANTFIQGLEGSTFDDVYKSQKIAEARYLRAHMYFQMARRYGGVPIITEPQSPDTPLEELNVPRSSEQDTYDFIASELDAIIPELPEDAEPGRVDKYVALALKSRAMLYAGSAGEFGSVQTIGSGGNQITLGITDPDTYWQASMHQWRL